ncbi:MAG: hypothetical protein KDI32_11800 [Pseudomonadales bacterium]|nr:hypothetical protein [Pseudomonadales bacterium]
MSPRGVEERPLRFMCAWHTCYMGIGSKGTRLFDRFALLAKLAATERGEVWSALDEQRHEVVAVELFGTDKLRRADDWSRLTGAHEVAARLAHSNVLVIDRPMRDSATVLLPMQLATGGDARRLIGAPYYEIVPVLIDIAEALRHAHRVGVAHLDLQPHNVLLDENTCALLKGFRFAGGTRQEFDAAVRKDLRDFSLLGSELLGKTAAAARAAPPRLWALFDRVYDASFGASPLSFDVIGAELEASRHDTAPLALARLDLTRPSRAIDRSPPAPPPLELEVESFAETAVPRVDGASVEIVDVEADHRQEAGIDEQAEVQRIEPAAVALPVDDGDSGAMPGVVAATPDCPQLGEAEWLEDDSVCVDGLAQSVPGEVHAEVDERAADREVAGPDYLVLPPTANDESSDPMIDGIEVPLVLEPEPQTRPIALPVQVIEPSGASKALVPIPAEPIPRHARKWQWLAAGFGALVVGVALWLSREAALDVDRVPEVRGPSATPAPVPAERVEHAGPSVAELARSQVAATAAAANEVAAADEASKSVAAQLQLADRALDNLDAARARRALLVVQRLEPNNPAVAVGLRRVQAIAGVRPLLADAARAEEARDYARAVQGYSHALALDSRQRAARDGMARIRRSVGDSTYGRELVDAYVHLGAGRLKSARAGFGKALIAKPDSLEADHGLERAEAALTAQRLAPLLRRAAQFEAQGQWADALREYNLILAEQPDYVLAQQGRQRVVVRVATSGVNVATGTNDSSFQQ